MVVFFEAKLTPSPTAPPPKPPSQPRSEGAWRWNQQREDEHRQIRTSCKSINSSLTMERDEDDAVDLEEDELARAWEGRQASDVTATSSTSAASTDWARGRFTGWKLQDAYIPLKVEEVRGTSCPLVVCVDVAFHRHVLASKEEPGEETHVWVLCLGGARGEGSAAARVCKLITDGEGVLPIDVLIRDGRVFAVYSRDHGAGDVAAALASSRSSCGDAPSVETVEAIEAVGAIARSLAGVRQSVFEAGKGNALQACVATCFRLGLASVPDFVAEAGAGCESVCLALSLPVLECLTLLALPLLPQMTLRLRGGS